MKWAADSALEFNNTSEPPFYNLLEIRSNPFAAIILVIPDKNIGAVKAAKKAAKGKLVSIASVGKKYQFVKWHVQLLKIGVVSKTEICVYDFFYGPCYVPDIYIVKLLTNAIWLAI